MKKHETKTRVYWLSMGGMFIWYKNEFRLEFYHISEVPQEGYWGTPFDVYAAFSYEVKVGDYNDWELWDVLPEIGVDIDKIKGWFTCEPVY